MSTSYYRLRPPITSLRLEEGTAHDRLLIWEGHGLAGVLTLGRGSGRSLALMLSESGADGLTCAAHIHYGGDSAGCVVTVNEPILPDSAVVVSEDGEVTTMDRVKAWHGRKAVAR
jgi:hypothetical protein